MVSIIENWASIQGEIKSVSSHPGSKGYLEVDLALKEALDIDGFPNLAKADEGNTIHINVKPEQLRLLNIKAGKPLCSKARKAFGQVYFLE